MKLSEISQTQKNTTTYFLTEYKPKKKKEYEHKFRTVCLGTSGRWKKVWGECD
jgi:hypothetical protein